MNDHPHDYQTVMGLLRKGIYWLEAEGFSVDRGDGFHRFCSQEELDHKLEILGSSFEEIDDLIRSVNE